MGEVILLRRGGKFFDEDYTAEAKDVLEGKFFLGRGSDSLQEGTKKVISPPDISLTINGTYNLEIGYHNAPQEITQSIPTSEATVVTPVGNGQTIQTSGKYWTGNLTLNALENFDPVYIKRGVTVGEGEQAITGNYEGFE